MSADAIVALAQVAAVLVAAFAIIVTLRGVRNQLWVIVFTEYTKRYADIVRDLPAEARQPNSKFDLSQLSGADRDRAYNAMRGYLNLCSEEFHLHKKGRIDHETWEIWTLGIQDTMRPPWFRKTWEEIRGEYIYFKDFCQFMDECLGSPRSSASSSQLVGTSK
jgi:hypothetical protein